MADVTNVYTTTYTTGYETGLVRDVDGQIGLWSPTDTPFMANMSTSAARQRKVEWMEDELREAGENAQLEGFEAVVGESEAPEFDDNWTQIFSKSVSASGTAMVVDMHGRQTSDLERQRGLRMKELARDMEWAFLNGVGNAGSKTTPRKMNGAFQFVDTATPAHFSFGDTPADTNHITEHILMDVMQGLWDSGVAPDTVLAPMTQRRKISAFTDKGRLTINQSASEKKVTMSVRVIETDMGTVALLSERFMQPTEAGGKKYDKLLVYKKDVFGRRSLRPIKKLPLAKTGDNEKELLVTEQTLQCSTRKGVGSIVNLSQAKM